MTSAHLQSRLLEDHGVAVISGTSFGEMGEGYLRFHVLIRMPYPDLKPVCMPSAKLYRVFKPV